MKKSVIVLIAILEAVLIVFCLIYIRVLYTQKTPAQGATAGVVQETAEDMQAQLEAVIVETEEKTELPEETENAEKTVVKEPGTEKSTETQSGGMEKAADFSDLTIVGDSISRMTKEKVEEALPGVEIHAMYGKTVDYSVKENLCGLSLVKLLLDEGRLRDRVVFALGTNNVDALAMNTLTPEMFEQLHEMTGDRPVYLVTAYDLYNPSVYEENNRVIKEMADKYDDWHVIDWARAVASHDPKKIIQDEGEAATGNCQVHPTDPEGIDLWVKTIAEGVSKKDTPKD